MSDLGADKQSFGKLVIGANLGDSELPGPSAAFIQAKTDDGVKFNASVHEGSGLSRIHADKCLQITAGEDCSNDHEALNLFATKGNVNIKSENNFVRISGKNVVIDATETLTLGGRVIKIGKDAAESDKTESISITGNSVDTDADDGNLAELLGTGPLMSIFAGTALAGAAAIAAGIGKAAGGAAGLMAGSEPIGVGGAGGAGGNLTGNSLTLTSTSGDVISITAEGDNIVIEGDLVVDSISTSGLSSEFLMADGSTTRRYIGVGIGSTPGGSGGNTLGEDGDIWYTLC